MRYPKVEAKRKAKNDDFLHRIDKNTHELADELNNYDIFSKLYDESDCIEEFKVKADLQGEASSHDYLLSWKRLFLWKYTYENDGHFWFYLKCGLIPLVILTTAVLNSLMLLHPVVLIGTVPVTMIVVFFEIMFYKFIVEMFTGNNYHSRTADMYKPYDEQLLKTLRPKGIDHP